MLNKAFQIINRINKSRAKLPDEVCYRTLIQLAGHLNHPALAVKVLFEMKRYGVQINAITWGDYHKAVLEGDWSAATMDNTAQKRWNKVRVVFMAMFAFMDGAKKRKQGENEDLLINIQPNSNANETTTDGNLLVALDNCSVASSGVDAGYGSGPLVDGGALVASSETDIISSNFRNSHRRNISNMSQLSESSMEDLGIKPQSLINRNLLVDTRRQSEISFSSNDFLPSGLNESLNDSNLGSLPGSLVDLQNTNVPRKPGIAIEAAICSCQKCNFCHKVIYDEEIMASWSPEDSNLNIQCPFCQTKKVPNLQIDVRDFRGVNSKACSMNSLGGSSSSSSTAKVTADGNKNGSKGSLADITNTASVPTSSTPVDIDPAKEGNLVDIPLDDMSPKAALTPVDSGISLLPTEGNLVDTTPLGSGISLTEGNLVELPLDFDGTTAPTPGGQDSNIDLLQDFLSTSTQQGPTADVYLLGLTSEPTPPPTKQQPPQHKKSNSVGNSNIMGGTAPPAPPLSQHKKSMSMGSTVLGAPVDKVTTHYVPYLSPLVLRKEVENLLKNHGESMLNEHRIVVEKPIIYWNLLWYFRRLNLPSHLPSLLLQSYAADDNNTAAPAPASFSGPAGGEVRICTSWDLNRQSNEHIPLYMLWNIPEERSNALTQQGHTAKSVLDTICNHIQENDVHIPMRMLLDERSRRQKTTPDLHWSLYRELLFLSLVSCGAENIDIDAFDREYSSAYRDKQREYAEILHPDDKSPRPKAVHCREAFEPPTLQIRRAQLY